MSRQIVALTVNFRTQNINLFCKDDFVRIFGYLESSEIARTVFPVCKLWREIGRDPLLWKDLNIDTLDYEIVYRIERQIMRVVQNATLLENLDLVSHDDVSRILVYVGRFCPRLKSLYIQFCSVGDDSSVETLVLGCPLIQKLYIRDASGSALNDFAKLKLLKLFAAVEGEQWYDDTFLSRLSTNNRHLERVFLDENENHDDSHLVPLFANLRYVLKHVDLYGSDCSSSTYEAIANCQVLESLSIYDAFEMKNCDLNKLKALTKIKCIRIANAKNISSNAFCSFITSVQSTELEAVTFETCPAVDHALEKVLESHNETIFHKVEYINLSKCKNITDRLVELILKGNPVLETLKLASILSLQGTAFNTSDTTIAPLLKTLNVSKCFQIIESYLYIFKKNRLHLSIVFPSDS